MNHEFRFTVEKIGKRLDLVGAHRFAAKRPLDDFRLKELAAADEEPGLNDDLGTWQLVASGDYWGGADFHFCLRSCFELPEDWTHPALHLPLGNLGDIFNHPEALLSVNGEIIGSVDRHHHTIALNGVAPGGHDLALQGWTGLYGWPPVAGAPDKLLMRQCYVVEQNPVIEEFLVLAACALESARLQDNGSGVRTGLLDALDKAFLALDTRDPLGADMHASAEEALHVLRTKLDRAGEPLRASLIAIGHAHMDIAYLWPVAESRQKNVRTYSNVLRLMERYPEYRFTHSQPQLYDYFRRDFPDMFEKVAARVADGQWEAIGGMWVEPDVNLAGAEALVRQILLGRGWFRDAFGDVETPILWLPDTFGFPWCLPQLMNLSGLEMMVTNKLNWSQHSRIPSSTMLWEGVDGSRVLVHVLTTPRKVQYLPFPTNYKSDLSGGEVLGTWTNASRTALADLPICYGFGDGGGGPTEELLARTKAFVDMPGMPRMRPGRASDFLASVKGVADELPVWGDELYLQGHRGVLTSQGWIKRANRRAETALHRIELLLVIRGKCAMPEALTDAWRLLCLNQFHDILAGTSSPRIYEDAKADYARIFEICDQTQQEAQRGLRGDLGVLNTSPLRRRSLGLIDGPAPKGVRSQATARGTLIDLPELQGYEPAVLGPSGLPLPLSIGKNSENFFVENTYIKAIIGADGTLHRLYDKLAEQDMLAKGDRGNQIWAFEDRPISWDAWDIDPFFEDRAEEVVNVASTSIVETGPLRVALRIERRFRNSRIVQQVCLTDRSPRLDFETEIDWCESHFLLKAAFPVSVQADRATYDIQWGQIARSTRRDTTDEASRFEVCGHKWAALHNGSYAVALLNDCKYGHDISGSLMRLTMLKSPTMPDPNADQGRHIFTYAIFPQSGPGFAEIRAEAEALNRPALVGPGLASLPWLVRSDKANVVVETVKPSENGRGFILRLYEAEGEQTRVTLRFSHSLGSAKIVNLLEDPLSTCRCNGRVLELELEPFQITSMRISLAPVE